MHYKTIVLELLQQQTEWHEQLRRQRQLLPTMERLAQELKLDHESLKGVLSQARPDSDPIQIASEALEIAIQELRDRFPSEVPPDE
ncbi:MAG: Uncharacterized protein FD138_885 [Planctomycetota bacterium]|nr:MAG: Uncharacterized protein FD138_885 [Planctomycetota bacterium]